MPRVRERTSPVTKRGICVSLSPEEGRHEPLKMQTAFDQAWTGYNASHEMIALGDDVVCLHRAGTGQPVVCIHGWAMGGLSFAAQLALIQHGFEIIAPDLPGFGGSPIPHAPPTIERMADLIGKLIVELGLSEVILVGWSMGASIAWHLAATDAARLKALVSIDMSPRVAPEKGWPFALSTGMTRETIDLAMQAMCHDWADYCELFLDRILAEPNVQIRSALAALSAKTDPSSASQAWLSLMQYDARTALSKIQIPALAVQGGRSVIYPQTVGHEIARLMPHCRALVLDRAGHAPHLEEHDTFNAHLLSLAQHGLAAVTLRQPLATP